MLVEKVVVGCEVVFREGNVVELSDVRHVVNSKAFLEIVWKLLYVFLVAHRQNHPSNVMVLTCGQLLPHTSNADYLSESGNFPSHCKVSSYWLVDGTRNKGCEQRGASRGPILGRSTHGHVQVVVVFVEVTDLSLFVK